MQDLGTVGFGLCWTESVLLFSFGSSTALCFWLGFVVSNGLFWQLDGSWGLETVFFVLLVGS